ncbi:MAG: hypothetical protein WCJ19_04015 [bacterium]
MPHRVLTIQTVFGNYTFESLGDSVPLLTQTHLNADIDLLNILHDHGIPFNYHILVADIEGTDSFFANKFTSGNESEFIYRCQSSASATTDYIKTLNLEYGDNFFSSTFFDHFGRERFEFFQKQYFDLLLAKYQNDNKFINKVLSDIIQRSQMYDRLYSLKNMSVNEKTEFLAVRTMRTMAQYLTLSRLISASNPLPIIINHETVNNGLFNEGNKYLLEGDKDQQKAIPLIILKNETK